MTIEVNRKPFSRLPDPPAKILREARRRWERGEADARTLAVAWGWSKPTVLKRVALWGWDIAKAKPDVPPSELPPAARKRPRPGPRHEAPARASADDHKALRRSLKQAIRRRILTLKDALDNPQSEEDMDRSARIFASLVKSLAELARLEGRSGEGDDASNAAPLDLAGLRAELVDRLGGPLRDEPPAERSGEL